MAVVASGGTESTSGGYKIHKFTADGTFTVTSAGDIEILVVAGGGGGGGNDGGGGGAGGFRTSTIATTGRNYTIQVGGLGAGGSGTASGTNGGDSVFDTDGTPLTATGGGGGGGNPSGGQIGKNGGSGRDTTEGMVAQGDGLLDQAAAAAAVRRKLVTILLVVMWAQMEDRE
jgi:hypothetical protein